MAIKQCVLYSSERAVVWLFGCRRGGGGGERGRRGEGGANYFPICTLYVLRVLATNHKIIIKGRPERNKEQGSTVIFVREADVQCSTSPKPSSTYLFSCVMLFAFAMIIKFII